MNELVFLEPNNLKSEPLTTSWIIAEGTENEHESIVRLLSTYKSKFEQFGKIRFSDLKSGNPSGGRPVRIYYLNEQQSTFLITLLKNTEIIVNFKFELVRQFYLMRDELMKRQIYREELKPIRRGMTDVIQANPGHSKWDYKLYTDLSPSR